MSPDPLPGHRDDPCDQWKFHYPEELQAEPDPPRLSLGWWLIGAALAVGIGVVGWLAG
jgi:hypothetical protein